MVHLSNYFHFRPGFNVNEKTIAVRGESFVDSIDIFETLDADKPEGVWTVQAERSGAVAVAKSFLWPGSIFYHVPAENKWGNFYYGTGQKNVNIAMML